MVIGHLWNDTSRGKRR